MKFYRALTIALALLVLLLGYLWLSGGRKAPPEKPQELWHTNTVELWKTNTLERWRTNTVEVPVTTTVTNTVVNEVIKEVSAKLSDAEKQAAVAGYKFLNAPALADAADTLYKASPLAVEVHLDESAAGLYAEPADSLVKTLERTLHSKKCQNDDDFDLNYPQVLELTIKGEKARAILLEKMADIKKELYLSLFLNRSKRCYTIIASPEGGVEIESVKNQIIREVGLGDVSEQVAREVAKEMKLEGKAADDFVDILRKLAKLTVEKEAELAEINPLAIMQDGSLMALDGKFVTDDNSNFRHDELQKYQEKTEIEERAEKSGFSLVELDGDIAVVGNGAGLVMSTLDMLSDNGGKPACFLDLGGGATTESVYEALTLIS